LAWWSAASNHVISSAARNLISLARGMPCGEGKRCLAPLDMTVTKASQRHKSAMLNAAKHLACRDKDLWEEIKTLRFAHQGDGEERDGRNT